MTRETEWSVIPVVGLDDLPDEKNPGGIAHLDAQAQDLGSMERIAAVAKQGGRLIWYPGQVDVSIRPGWFYHASEDDRVKSLDQLLDIYFTSVGGNAQLLLNIPPDKRGRIHENDARRLKELGDRIGATFAVNLARGKAFTLKWTTAGGDVPGPGVSTKQDAPIGVIEHDLGGLKTFNAAKIEEDTRYGQRIEAFALDAWDGKDWGRSPAGRLSAIRSSCASRTSRPQKCVCAFSRSETENPRSCSWASSGILSISSGSITILAVDTARPGPGGGRGHVR